MQGTGHGTNQIAFSLTPASRILNPLFIQLARKESNPRFRHGKAVGCRYIMGACFVVN